MPALITPAPAIFFAPLCAAALLLLCVAAGRRIARLLGAPTSLWSVGERCVIFLGLGAGVIALVPFALGAFGSLSVLTLRVALGVVGLVFAVDLWAVVVAGARAAPAFRPRFSWKTALLGALVPCLLAAFLVGLAPSLDADGLAYHLTVPKRWLASGSLVYLPTYMFSNTPMAVEMLFTIGLAFAGDAAAKLVHLGLGICGALAVYHAGARLQSKTIGVVSATMFLAGPTAVGGLLGFGYTEGAIAFAIATGTLSWLTWLRTRDIGVLRVTALLIGIAISFKITAILFAVAIAALTVISVIDEARRSGTTTLGWSHAGQVLALGLAPVLPWFVRSAIVTGNPLFPLFAKLIPTRDLLPETAAMFDRYNRYFLWASRYNERWGVGFRQLLLLAAAGVVLCLTVFAFLRLRSTLAKATAIVLGLTVVLQLSAVGLYVRYWVPVLPTLALPLLAVVEGALLKFRFRWLLVAVTAVGSLNQARASTSSAANDLRGLVGTALGRESYPEFLNRHIVLYPMYEHINAQLPATARIALSYSCRGFYIDRTTFCTEFPQDALGFSSWPAFLGAVQRLGVTHFMAPKAVALGEPPPTDFSGPAMMYKGRKDQYIARLLSKHGRLIAEGGDQGLYVLEGVADESKQ